MEDENLEERDDLTPDEVEAAEETGMSGEEAHRYEEFRVLEEKIDRVLDACERLEERIRAVNEGMGVFGRNGATVREEPDEVVLTDEEPDTDVYVPLEELDLTLDED